MPSRSIGLGATSSLTEVELDRQLHRFHWFISEVVLLCRQLGPDFAVGGPRRSRFWKRSYIRKVRSQVGGSVMHCDVCAFGCAYKRETVVWASE